MLVNNLQHSFCTTKEQYKTEYNFFNDKNGYLL